MLNPLGNKELMRTLYPKPVRCIIQLPFGHCEGCEIEIVIVYKNSLVVVRLNFGGPPSFCYPPPHVCMLL